MVVAWRLMYFYQSMGNLSFYCFDDSTQ